MTETITMMKFERTTLCLRWLRQSAFFGSLSSTYSGLLGLPVRRWWPSSDSQSSFKKVKNKFKRVKKVKKKTVKRWLLSYNSQSSFNKVFFKLFLLNGLNFVDVLAILPFFVEVILNFDHLLGHFLIIIEEFILTIARFTLTTKTERLQGKNSTIFIFIGLFTIKFYLATIAIIPKWYSSCRICQKILFFTIFTIFAKTSSFFHTIITIFTIFAKNVIFARIAATTPPETTPISWVKFILILMVVGLAEILKSSSQLSSF